MARIQFNLTKNDVVALMRGLSNVGYDVLRNDRYKTPEGFRESAAASLAGELAAGNHHFFFFCDEYVPMQVGSGMNKHQGWVWFLHQAYGGPFIELDFYIDNSELCSGQFTLRSHFWTDKQTMVPPSKRNKDDFSKLRREIRRLEKKMHRAVQ